eukprot:CAMPEP_0194480702 /NCGR_PEP_ID=MMETSP0253-20130528/3414_1 /TAXON_ID=2966 /ORGANISM="Noctiluca scintillans" /LENGTH=63 /DNA_ID=CAMNT_0039320119 /DNA_START=51 /DNA_END=242 /DNA_ORIENTATION=-
MSATMRSEDASPTPQPNFPKASKFLSGSSTLGLAEGSECLDHGVLMNNEVNSRNGEVPPSGSA